MNWWLRALLWVASALLSDVLVCVAFQIGYSLHGDVEPHWYAPFGFALLCLILVVPATLVTLPIIFLFTRPAGWRLPAYLLLGVVLGPAYLYLGYLRAVLVGTWHELPRAGLIDAMAAAVSGCTTLIYVSILRVRLHSCIQSKQDDR